jgi:hypothetical protein
MEARINITFTSSGTELLPLYIGCVDVFCLAQLLSVDSPPFIHHMCSTHSNTLQFVLEAIPNTVVLVLYHNTRSTFMIKTNG